MHAGAMGFRKAAAQADATGASSQRAGRRLLCALSCSIQSQISALKAAAKMHAQSYLKLRVHACAGAWVSAKVLHRLMPQAHLLNVQ